MVMIRSLPNLPYSRLPRFALLSISVILAGCSAKPSRIAAPDWEPEASAERAVSELDKDGNGTLSATELDGAPGLKACLKYVDSNGDGQIGPDEIIQRISLYRESRVGLAEFSCAVLLDGKPLADAQVTLVPEPFLGEIVEPATGTSEGDGVVQPSVAGESYPGVRIGMYRVEITSPSKTVPPKYNSQTTLGVEVAPVMKPVEESSPMFRLTSR